MSEYSGCKKEDFKPLMESYKEEFISGCGGNKGTLPKPKQNKRKKKETEIST